MHRGQYQVVLVLVRRRALVSTGLGRIQGQLGQEALTAAKARRKAVEVLEICRAYRRIAVQPLELRRVPLPQARELAGPLLLGRKLLQQAGKLGPVRARCCGNGSGGKRRQGSPRLPEIIQAAPCHRGPDTGQQLQRAKAREFVTRIVDEAQHRECVLYV